MRDPRMVAVCFESIVRAIGATLFLRKVAPVLASLMAVTVLAVSDNPVLIQVREHAEQTLEQIAEISGVNHWLGREHLRGPLQVQSDAELALEHGPAPKLTTEQSNLARYIARTYRVSIERTRHYVDFAYRVAGEKKLDPVLLLALMAVESSFNSQAESSKGAQGLMQVLTRVHVEKFAPFGGPIAAFEPLPNIHVGARILREYIAREGSVEQALKSYVGAALMADDGGYGDKVLFERQRLQAVAAGKPLPVYNPARISAKPATDEALNKTVEDGEPIPEITSPEPKPVEGRDSASL